MVMVLQPPPIRGLSQTGGFELMIEDRSGKGVDALQQVVDRFQDEARKRPELAGRLLDLLGPGAPAQVRRRPHQGPAARRADLRPLRHAPGQPRRLLRQRLRPLRQGLEGHGPGRGGRADQARGHPEPLRPEPQGGAGPAQLPGRGPLRPGADRRAPLQPLRLGQDQRRARPGVQLGPGARRDAGGRRRGPARGVRLPSGPARPSRSRRPATRRPTSSPSRSSASSCSWRPSTRAGSGPRSSS